MGSLLPNAIDGTAIMAGRFGREASGLSIDDLAGDVRSELRANLERAALLLGSYPSCDAKNAS